jgi:hypothetical protein
VTIDVDGAKGAKTGSITATAGHPFWAPHLHKWVNAGDLKAGSMLKTGAGTYVKVTATRAWIALAQQVRNLTVDGLHTYYVVAGTTPVLVHNCNPVYRGMQTGEDGLPVIGRSPKQLGVRVDGDNVDVNVTPNGTVMPGEGASVNTSPRGMPTHRRPPGFGGTAKNTDMYCIDTCGLPKGLVFQPDHGTHGVLGPAFEMPLSQYEELLASTQSLWQRVLPD